MANNSKSRPSTVASRAAKSGSIQAQAAPAGARVAAGRQAPAAARQPAGQLGLLAGEAGETHQVAASGDDVLTTNQGIPVADNQNQLKAGARGPVLLEDFVLREKIFHFDHERIPERIVHARGSAAHGYFEVTESLADVTRAALFQEKGKRVPVFVRFSTVAGGAGSVDTPRDVRGFAVKLYTEEGNWDLVGNNIPVFFIQDAMKFPDLVHAVKMEADRGYPQAASAHDTFWDFVSLTPESFHMIMWAMSDRTLPRSFATMEGFGVHTFRLIDAAGRVTFAKFHWKPEAGLQSTIWDETVKIAGADPDFHRRDLFERIRRGDFPSWQLGLQLFTPEQADALPFDVLDPTKLIPEELVPVRIVGRMVLDRNPDNFFAETEQVAFCPANLIPGIDFSEDPLLQGRLFSYLDTQKSRLGTANFHQLPINAPKCPFANFQRDGQFQMQVPKGRANYEPNSLAAAGEPAGPREAPQRGFVTAPVALEGTKERRRAASFADHYSQARQFFRSLSAVEQAHLCAALIFELSKVDLPGVCERVLGHLGNVDAALARRVANGLGLAVPAPLPAAVPVQDLPESPALRVIEGPRSRATIAGSCIGVLVGPGSPSSVLRKLRAELEEGGAHVVTVAPRRHVTLDDGKDWHADAQLAGSPSVLYDAVAVVLAADAATQLVDDAGAVQWLADAFAHLKAIGATDHAAPLLGAARVRRDAGVVGLEQFAAAACRRYFEREPAVRPVP